MQWSLRGMTELIEHVHPTEIKPGMRMPLTVTDMKPSRELLPVWAVQYNGGGRYGFRLSNGEQRFAKDCDRIYAVREIRPEDRPPYEGEWVTNEPFGFHDHKPGVTPDREFYANSWCLDTYEAPDGRVYRLLSYRHWVRYWVCRWDQGKKWCGPSRLSADNAREQFAAIVSGKAW